MYTINSGYTTVLSVSKVFQWTETFLVASTVVVATGTGAAAVVEGSIPLDLNTFILSVTPPYESDDKRIYPDRVLEEKRKSYPAEERHYE